MDSQRPDLVVRVLGLLRRLARQEITRFHVGIGARTWSRWLDALRASGLRISQREVRPGREVAYWIDPEDLAEWLAPTTSASTSRP